MQVHDLLAGIGVAAGLVGIILVVTPGLVIEIAAVAFWALIEGSTTGWLVLLLSVLVAAAGTFLKFQRPGRRLKASGVPTYSLLLASLAGFIGLFVIPVVGGPIAFVMTLFLLTWARVGRDEAWSATKTSLVAIGHAVGIELVTGVLVAFIWLVGVIVS